MGVEGGSVLIPSRAQILEKLMRHVYFKQYFTRDEFKRENIKSHLILPCSSEKLTHQVLISRYL